jgi:hypothetical protein
MKRSPLTLITAATLLAGAAMTSSPAHAGQSGPGPQSTHTIATGLVTPFKLAVDDHGRSYVSENFIGELTRIKSNGQKTTFATSPVPGEELGGVSEHDKTVYWTTTGDESAKMYAQRKGHAPRQIADVYDHENRKNPDQYTTYGFRHLPKSCSDKFTDPENPASYMGQVDSHPYATLVTNRNKYIADAGANAIFKVGKHGKVRTVAVMPGIPSVITAEVAAAQHIPSCAVGHKYYFEFVPTDVEKGRDGWLYVTSLPGGPEDASLGARGGLFKVNPHNGKVRKVAGGFVGAVDVAVSPDGRVAVAELFADRITLLKPWSSYRKSLPMTSPGAVEWVGSKRHSKLYVTTNVFVGGQPGPTGKLKVLSFGSHH